MKNVFATLTISAAILSASLLTFAADPMPEQPTGSAASPAVTTKKEELKAKITEEKGKVTSACSAEIEKAGCSGKEIGKGLMKCIQAYKKTNKDFKISDSCKASAKEFREERKELKAARAAAKSEKK